MEQEQDLSGMNAEARLVTTQMFLKSVINSLQLLQSYLDNTDKNETSAKVNSILDLVVKQLGEIHQNNEKVLGML